MQEPGIVFRFFRHASRALVIAGMMTMTACEKSEGNIITPVGTGERPEGTTAGNGDLFLAAVRRGDFAAVRRYLENDANAGETSAKDAAADSVPANLIQARDGLGSSALLLAVRKTDQLPLVQYLYEANPQALDAGDSRGRTPLSWAAHFDRATIAAFLIERGAKLETTDRAGNTPLAYAAMRDAKATAKLLISKGANVNVRNEVCDTPLMLAAARGHVELTRLLAQNGADPGYQDQEGRVAADRLRHLDDGTRRQIRTILAEAPRSAMNPACES